MADILFPSTIPPTGYTTNDVLQQNLDVLVGLINTQSSTIAAATYVTATASSVLSSARVLTSGTAITLTDNGAGSTLVINNTGVTTITGTSNQVIANNPSGAVTLSLPQNIHTGASPTFSGEILTAVSNQLVLGTTRTVTFNAPTPAVSSRTITFSDLSTDYSVVATEAAQTINGVKTFSSGIVSALSGTGGRGLVMSNLTNSQAAYLEQYGSGTTDTTVWSVNRFFGNGSPVSNNTGFAAAYIALLCSNGDSSIQFRTTSSNNVDPQNRLNIDKNGLFSFAGNITFSSTSLFGIVGTTTNDSAAAGNVGQYVESVVASVSIASTGTYGDLTFISLTAGDWDITGSTMLETNGATSVASPILGISTTSGNSATGLVSGSSRLYYMPPTGSASIASATIASLRVSITGTTTYYLKHFATYATATPLANARLSARRVR